MEGALVSVEAVRVLVDREDREYTIGGLQEYITYSITVRASNSLSTANSTAVDGTTSEASQLILFIRHSIP